MLSIIKRLKTFSNEKGFTLVEGMVTAGLLGVVSLAMLQGFKQDNTTKQLMRLEDEIQSAMKTVNSVLKDTASCSATLTTTTVNVPVTGAAEIQSLRQFTGSVASYRVASTGTVIPIQKDAIISGSTTADANLVISNLQVQNFKEFFRFEENMGNGASAGIQEVSYGVVEFVISFTRKTGVGEDEKRIADIRRSVNITVKALENGVNNYRIIGCANQSDITALQLKQRVCSQMIQYTGSLVMVGSYDPQSGTCGGIIDSDDNELDSNGQLSEVTTDLICREMGGHLVDDGAGRLRCAVVPSGLPNCMNGFSNFGDDGRPICITP